MSYSALVNKVLIASPSDVSEERETIAQAIYAWNFLNSEAESTVLLPIRWETHSTPEFSGNNPQEILNVQLVRDCDMVVAVFWTKIGSPTEFFESGTLEEIEQFIQAGKPILVYFSKRDLPRDVDLEQVQRLRLFKQKYQGEGIYKEYEDSQHITQLLKDDLTRIIRKTKTINSDNKGNELILVFPTKAEVSTQQRRQELESELNTLFHQNERVFLEYGPYSVRAQQLISESAGIWREKCKEILIPNNQKVVDLLRDNFDLIPQNKLHVFDAFINHVEGFKDNHLSEFKERNVPTFPKEIKGILN